MAQTATQKHTLTGLLGGGTATTHLSQFDPALGTLTGVTLAVTTTVAGAVAVENLDLGPVELAAGLPASLSVYSYQPFLYYASLLTATATASGAATLAAFDGASDFAGASGVTLSGLSGTHTDTIVIAADDYRASLFVGNSELVINAAASTSFGLTAGASLRVLSAISAIAAEVAVTYDYTPLVAGGGTGGSVFTLVLPVFTSDVVTTVVGIGASVAPQLTMTTGLQRVSLAEQTTGWTDTVSLPQFDPARGNLVAVNLRLGTTLRANAALETHIAGYSSTLVQQTVQTSVSVAGTTLATAGAAATRYAYTGVPDGVDDFAGPGGQQLPEATALATTVAHVNDASALAQFTGTGTVDLALHAAGAGQVQGVSDLLAALHATAGATLEVSYTYAPSTPVAPIAVNNGTNSFPARADYTGPVGGIVSEFIDITGQSLAISAEMDSWYIRTGDGNDAIRVFGGTNVLDAGGGSNFLTGGAGDDTFFVDANWSTAPEWNTINAFSPGDAVTIWGITPEGYRLSWRDDQGAPGSTGLTLHARAAGAPIVSTTLAGYTVADLSNGRLATSFGTADDVPYLYIRAT
jgi:hypothetical protein